MFDTHAVGESFGRAAADYDAHADLQREVRVHCLRLAEAHWKKGARILDVGCGTGALMREAAQRKLGWNIVGVDIAAGMCGVAGKYAINADAESLPVASETFDGVFSSLMLQWVNRPAAAFSEMARVLKPKSHAVLSTLAEGTLFELSQAFSNVDNAPHVSEFAAPHLLLQQAQENGFTLVKAEQATLVEYYPDAIALMRKLQAIGAANRHSNRRKGLATSRQFARLEKSYRQRFATARGLPASWRVLTLILQKI